MKTILKSLFLSFQLILMVSCCVDGVDGQDGIDGTNGIDGQDASGVTYVYFNGNITDAEAALKVQNEIGSITQFIYIENTTQLTTLDLSGVTNLVSLQIDDNQALTTLNVSNLVEVSDELSFDDTPLLASLDLLSLEKVSVLFIDGSPGVLTCLQQIDISALTEVYDLYIRDTNVTSLSLNNLSEVFNIEFQENLNLTLLDLSGVINGNKVIITESASLTTLNLSNLSVVDSNLLIYDNDLLTSIDLSSLTSAVQFTIHENDQLASINLPQLTNTFSSFNLYRNVSLSSINFPSIVSFNQVYFPFNNLDSTEVNRILNQLVAISPSFSGKNISLYDQQTAAPPTGQGVADYNTLVANGNNVFTD